MDISESNTISDAEISRKNKLTQLSQVISKSLSISVDDCVNPLTLTPEYANLPELKSDKEIEDVLCKISELLTSNSVISSAPELQDSRSIEEILKEAEDIVKENSSYFDDDVLKSSRVDGCNIDALSDRTECSVELEHENSRNNVSNSSFKESSKSRDNEEIKSNNKINSPAINSQSNHTCNNVGANNSLSKSYSNDKVNKPLSLRDLDIPDRPTNLNLCCDIKHVDSVKKVNQVPDNPATSTPKLYNLENKKNYSNNQANELNGLPLHCRTVKSISDDLRKSRTFNGTSDSLRSSNSSLIAKEAKLVKLGIISTPPASLNELPSIHNNNSKTCTKLNLGLNMDYIKKAYEEKIFDLERQIRILNSKLAEMERNEDKSGEKIESEKIRLTLLEKEVKSQEELIAGYQTENKRLLSETNKAKKVWVEAEQRLGEKVTRLERELKRANTLNITEALELKEQLADARDDFNRLEEQAENLKRERYDLETRNKELSDEMKRLRTESEGYRVELELIRTREKEKERRAAADASLASANLQGKLSQANSELARKQTEVVKLNTEVTRLRGDLERARLGSVVTGEANLNLSTSHQVRQLEIALERERENSRRAVSQLESLNKHNLDLARQVKELEIIVKRRSRTGSGIPWGDDSQSDAKLKTELEAKTKKLEQQLTVKDKQLVDHQSKLVELQNKYEKEVSNLQDKLKVYTSGRSSSTASLRNQLPRNAHQQNNSDAQLLATIRGLKAEVAAKDKQLLKIGRELDDAKRKMTRSNHSTLSLGRSAPLNNNRPNSNLGSKNSESSSSGPPSVLESGPSLKNYNPFLFEDDQETMLFLRNENANLHEEVKRLEQDLINLHNKRIQDLSELESNHSSEVKRALREQTTRQSNAQITHLRGQVYTQQMVITHLKNQIKILEQKNQEVTVLKAERDQLEGSLLEANKKVATLHQLSSPDSNDYADLLEKLEWLERRHELREAKLQTIVKELVARQQKTNVCSSSSCKDKLYNKNREICYYRAEIDKILDSLTEFKYIK